MSSILRALKKLESDPRHQEENRPLDSKFVTLADTEPQRSLSRALVITVCGGFVCGLVILLGWWFLSGQTSSSSSPTEKIASSKITEQPPHETLQQEPARQNTFTVAEPENRLQTAPAATVEPEKPLLPEPQSPGEALATADTPSPASGGQAVVIRTEKQVVPAAGLPVPLPPEGKKTEIPKLKDPDMKLQAVTWSRVPQKRIAVINNRILREGESVSGYLVVTINQDDVILILEGQKSKLLFR